MNQRPPERRRGTTDGAGAPAAPPAGAEARAERLKAALRANLGRRKQ